MLISMSTNDIDDCTAYDVLLGRHRHCFHHVGNQAFRSLITKFMSHYSTLDTKREKMNLVTLILNIIQQGGGRFLREVGESTWNAVKKRTAREKISHALRDHCNRLQFRNTGGTAVGDANEDTTNICWRTLVYETLQAQEKGSSKKNKLKSVNDVALHSPTQDNEDAYAHLDTKNLYSSSSSVSHVEHTRQQIPEIASRGSDSTSMATSNKVETTRRNLMNTMMRSQQNSFPPLPHYMPTAATTTSSTSPYSGLTVPDAAMRNHPLVDTLPMSDARRQIEMMLGTGGMSLSNETATTVATVAMGMRQNPIDADDSVVSSMTSGAQTFGGGIPQRAHQLVAPPRSRHSLLPYDAGPFDQGNETADSQMSALGMDRFEGVRRDSLGASYHPFDAFLGGRGDSSAMNTSMMATARIGFDHRLAMGQGESNFDTNVGMGIGSVAAVGSNALQSTLAAPFAASLETDQTAVSTALLDMHHHQHEHHVQDEAIDPIPIVDIQSQQQQQAFPPPASYPADDTPEEVSSSRRQHRRKNTEQQIDSMLLDLFER